MEKLHFLYIFYDLLGFIRKLCPIEMGKIKHQRLPILQYHTNNLN